MRRPSWTAWDKAGEAILCLWSLAEGVDRVRQQPFRDSYSRTRPHSERQDSARRALCRIIWSKAGGRTGRFRVRGRQGDERLLACRDGRRAPGKPCLRSQYRLSIAAETTGQIVQRFMSNGSSAQQLGETNPLAVKMDTFEPGAGDVRRIDSYHDDRDRADRDSTARISPYLSAGVVPTRALVRAGMEHAQISKMDASRGSGPGVWTMELGMAASAFLRCSRNHHCCSLARFLHACYRQLSSRVNGPPVPREVCRCQVGDE